MTRLFRTALTAFVLVPFAVAPAHPKLLSSVPAAGSRAAAPRQLSLTFNETVTPALSRIALTNERQQVIELGAVRADAANDHVLLADVKGAMANGRYTVRWQATGGDSHPLRGSYAFEVTAAPAP